MQAKRTATITCATTFAVTDALRVYQGHDLVAEIPASQFPQLIEALAKGLRRNNVTP